MKRLLITLIISAASLFTAAQLLPENVHISSVSTALIAAGLLAVANTFIKPILKLVTFPINMATLGLFSLVINAAILLAVAYFVDGFAITGDLFGFFWAVILGFGISFFTGIFEKIIGIFW